MFYLAQQINPDCALCFYNIGNSLFARAQYKKAISCWLKTAELEPTHPQINYRIAQAYWSEGDMDRAREHFLAELRVNPGEIDVILDYGLFLLEVGDIESAKEKFNRILEIQPDFALALFYLGEIAFDDRDYDRAAQLFKQAIRQDNTLTGPRYRLAQYALMKELWQEAANYLVSELKLAPDDVDTLVSMGSMFLTTGDLDYATNCMMRAIDIDCAHAQAYYYLGLINAMKGRFEESAEFFAHTLDIKPEHICALRDSAVVYMAMGRLDDAAVRIKKALPLTDDDSQLKTLSRRVRLLQATERISDFLCRFRR